MPDAKRGTLTVKLIAHVTCATCAEFCNHYGPLGSPEFEDEARERFTRVGWRIGNVDANLCPVCYSKVPR